MGFFCKLTVSEYPCAANCTVLTMALWFRNYDHPQETEAQRGQAICLKPHSWSTAEPRVISGSQAPICTALSLKE